ncbi:MAG: helix-turn-helix domain-containing protein [Treponema sp.]|nr:helix-turn-helix domain-containing protein [Treponema sp.]
MTEQELKTIVRTNIKRYREFRKWTQHYLAEKVDVSVNFLSDLETGKKWFSLATIIKFAAVLNIEPFELFKPADAPEPSTADLISRYNNEVLQAVDESLKHVYRYYQAMLKEKLPGVGAEIPKIHADAGPYEVPADTEYHGLVAENDDEK